jgi:hypothetical protein
MLTQEERENKPQTPLADATRGLSDFFVEPVGVFGFDAAQVLASLETPELREKHPMGAEEERHALEVLEEEAQQQASCILRDLELAVVLDCPALMCEKVLKFDAAVFVDWRRCHELWGAPVEFKKEWEMQTSLDLGDPTRNPAASQPCTRDNLTARALLAPKMFAASEKPAWNTTAPSAESCFHEGYAVLSAYTDVFSAPEESVELGLVDMPRHMLKGRNALLWFQTHRIGLVFLSCLPDPEAFTETQAARLLRKLRKGTFTPTHIFRMWLLTHYSSMRPTAALACEITDRRALLELRSDEGIEGYRDALRRLTDRNRDILTENRDKFNFDDETGWHNPDVLSESMALGKQLIEDFEEGWDLSRDTELALRHAGAAGAACATDMERLACLWLQAHVDQNESLLRKLDAWGAPKQLRAWVIDYAAGRRWLRCVGAEWTFAHLPEAAQLLGWASNSEWVMLNELRRYAMQNAIAAFIDVRGNHHTIWSRSLLDRYDVNNTKY